MAKATNGVKRMRVRTIYELLLSDTPRPDIIEYAGKNWDVRRATVDNYIAIANELIETEAALMEREAFAQAITKHKALRHSALKDGDKRLAFDITKDINKLLNLYPAKESKATATNLDIDLTQLTDEQLQRIADGEDVITVMADKYNSK